MKSKSFFPVFAVALILSSLALQTGMSRRGEYDEEAREQERLEKAERKAEKQGHTNPFKNMASGVKQATVDSASGFVSDTTQGTKEDAAVIGTLEGARKGSEKVLDNAIKGVSKVATLGYGEIKNYEIEEPETGKDEPTKIKIKIPGT